VLFEWSYPCRFRNFVPLLAGHDEAAGHSCSQGLFNEVIELHLRLRTSQTTRVLHDLLVGITVAVGLDVGFRCPFGIGDEFVHLPAAEELFRNAALLLDHEWRALLFPDLEGGFDFGWVDCDMDESDYGHGVLQRYDNA